MPKPKPKPSQDRAGSAFRRMAALGESATVAGLSDGELLERFAAGGDRAELAFEILVARHGPMVLRACRATLPGSADAQDAFQATFLLLARRAGSLWVRDSIGPWLHSVACRVAAGARVAEARRRSLERKAAGLAAARRGDGPAREEFVTLHEAVESLPERFRAPVVLCYLEGLTHEQAADHLACPVGTVRSRLARGRDRLRRELARRGISGHPDAETIPSTPALVPAALVAATVRSASTRPASGLISGWLIPLLERTVAMMTLHPLKLAGASALATAFVVLGFGPEFAPGQAPPAPDQKPADEPASKAAVESRFEAMERRLRDLEAKLDAAERKPARPAAIDPAKLTKIRMRFDNGLVDKVFVEPGQAVKKGDAVVEVRSPELAAARNDCRTKFVQWDHDHKYLVAREPLRKDGRLTQSVWVDTQNDEKKSRLDYLVARDKLAYYGMTAEETDKLLEGLIDDHDQAQPAKVETQDLARMTLRSPVDGRVVAVEAEVGEFYGMANVLVTIAADTPKAPAAPVSGR